jgi:hypothetical protein
MSQPKAVNISGFKEVEINELLQRQDAAGFDFVSSDGKYAYFKPQEPKQLRKIEDRGALGKLPSSRRG